MLQRANFAIRSLTNSPRLVKIARDLHLAGVLKRCEYQIRGPSDGMVRHSIAGVDIVFAVPNATEFRTLECCYGDELDFIEALEKKLRLGGDYFDVGSNVGQFLIPAAKLLGERGRAVGFEPHPVNHERLMKNVTLNRLTNVQVYQTALGDRGGEIRIYGARGTATIVPRAAAKRGNSPSATVQMIRGDKLRVDSGLPVPKAVKIDVEGAEYSVLNGLTGTLSSSLCELLCLEIHPRFLPPEVTSEMVLSLVRSLGFTRVETRPRESEIHLIAEKGQAER